MFYIRYKETAISNPNTFSQIKADSYQTSKNFLNALEFLSGPNVVAVVFLDNVLEIQIQQ
jgi:hypothetical protein